MTGLEIAILIGIGGIWGTSLIVATELYRIRKHLEWRDSETEWDLGEKAEREIRKRVEKGER